MSGLVGAARSEGEPYRCGLAPLDDALGEDTYPLPVFNQRGYFASDDTRGSAELGISQEYCGCIATYASLSSRSLGMAISSILSIRFVADSSS